MLRRLMIIERKIIIVYSYCCIKLLIFLLFVDKKSWWIMIYNLVVCYDIWCLIVDWGMFFFFKIMRDYECLWELWGM